MIATSSTGRPKLSSMPMIAITASVVCIALSEGQGGQHYRVFRWGRTTPHGLGYPLDAPWRPSGFVTNRQPQIGSKRRMDLDLRRTAMKMLLVFSALAAL